MAIIKCKMCGGDLELSADMTVAKCEFCGTKQTVPTADNEKKLTLFARANRLRAACEFDKAAGVYESIVAEFPEEAEAYWGLVLCQYGIEYVDDPATGKKIPTCHRSSFDSVMDDSNFEQAMENADEAALRVYREEAKEIERIRKGILEVSSAEQPYDIFICYKETASNGDRTVDSLLAENIYDALTDKGYRVFFSRITLESTLGIAYEPYIFAALNSAKIMLAVGTCYEHYNAVWVKNEWSRYLKIIAQDKNKYLIPCYKNIDPYDIPKEFSHLQGQDMGKVGAIQDLLRGIEKILPKQKAETVIQERVVVGGGGDNKIASLLDRGNMALEDGDWAKADSFFEDVLNNDSKNAQAYLGKTLAVEKCRTVDAFARKRKNATEYAETYFPCLELEEEQISEMTEKYCLPGYVSKEEIHSIYSFAAEYESRVDCRKEQYDEEKAYWANHKWLSKAERFATGAVAQTLAAEKKALFAALAERVKTAEAEERAARKAAEEQFASDLKEANEKAERLYTEGLARREAHYQELAQRREANYQELLQIAKTSCDVAELTDTAKKFDKLGDYQDSKNLAEHCRKRADEEQEKLDAEKERQRILKEKAERERKAKNKKIGIISGAAAGIIIAVVVVLTTVVIPAQKYSKAEAMLADGSFMEAAAAFEAMGDYKDAVQAVDYARGNYLLACARNRDAAGIELINVPNGSEETPAADDSEELHQQGIINMRELLQEAELDEADIRAHFAEIDAYAQTDDLWYAMYESGNGRNYVYEYLCRLGYPDFEADVISVAYTVFDWDADALVEEIWPQVIIDLTLSGEEKMAEKLYDGAYEIFVSLGDYRDSATLAETAMAEKVAISEDKKVQAYAEGESYLAKGDFESAIACFKALGDYKDSKEQILNCDYSIALAFMEAGEYEKAIAAFEALGEYKDSRAQIDSSNTAILDGKYDAALSLMKNGDYTKAITEFEALDGYKDSNQQIEQCKISLYGEDVWNKIKDISVGGTYVFGAYEQDNNTFNGKEAIEWKVLAVEGSKVFVISKYALDNRQYSEYGDVTWESSNLRKWLNNEFVNAAFSTAEKAMIPTTTVSAGANPNYDTSPGAATQDRIFLLSIEETQKYSNSVDTWGCEATEYAQNAELVCWASSDKGYCKWWLRSPGKDQLYAATLSFEGIDHYGSSGNSYGFCVRPAMWIDFSA